MPFEVSKKAERTRPDWEEPMYLYGRNIEAEIEKAKQLRAEHLREVLSDAGPGKAFGWLVPLLQAAVLRLFRGRSQSAA
jgi:hypothetical protein